jgi:hypothetical protein
VDSYIDLSALGQVLLASLLIGAGLVAVFSVGLVGLSAYEGAAGRRRTAAPLGLAVAGVCFAVVLGGVGLGLWSILNK